MSSPMVPPKLNRARALPPQQPEHFLALLELLCISNWIALGVVVVVATILRSSEQFYWPVDGGFSLNFSLIGLEFGLSNLALSLALRFRGWYQRTPREALNRLKQLTMVVLAWDGLHVLGAFVVFGGLNGPLAPLLPLMVAVGFLILPSGQAALFAGGMLSSTAFVVYLQIQGVLYPDGALGSNFHGPASGLALSLLILLAISGGAFVAGLKMRNRLLNALGSHPENFIDTRFGCFSETALLQRLSDELVRRAKVGGESSLLLLSLKQVDQLVAHRGLDAVEDRLRALLDTVLKHTRTQLDTCAYLGDASIGVLLPTASLATAQSVADRITQDFRMDAASDSCTVGIATASAQSDFRDVREWIAAAENALRSIDA